MNILIITENESSDFVRITYRKKHTAFIRRNIVSALDLLKHKKIDIMIIDKSNVIEDLLEFILNAFDVANQLKLFVHYELTIEPSWEKICPVYSKIEAIKTDYFEERLNQLELN